MHCRYAILIVLAVGMIYAVSSEELLELMCLDGRECQQFQHDASVNATCKEGACQCHVKATGKRIKCQPKENKLSNIIGGPCPCTQPHAECNAEQDKCYCEIGFMPSNDLRRCVPVAVPLGATCELDAQCQARDNFAKCMRERNICLCRDDYAAPNGSCTALIAQPAHNCTADVDCINFGVQIKCARDLNTCICPPEHVASAAMDVSICLPFVAYGGKCRETAQCQGILGVGGVCIGKACHCADDFDVLVSTSAAGVTSVRCQHVPVRGQYCRVHADCHQPKLPIAAQTLDCSFGQCDCREYHWNNNGDCASGKGNKHAAVNVSLMLYMVTIVNLLSFAAGSL